MTIPSKKRKERDYQAIIRNVFVCSKQEFAPFATAFSISAENFDQQKFGNLFGIIKVDDRSEDSSYVVNLLISVIKKEYFGKPERSAEESFEASLRKANLALAELARHGATSWAGKINFVGGAIEKNNLHFACLGNVTIFLLRGNEIAEISEGLKEERRIESHPLKTFSNISSGKLETGDKLIFTTRELMDIFSGEELRQNASHFSREEFPGFLEVSLAANSELAGTIVVDLVDSREIKPLIVEAPVIGKGQVKKIDSFVRTRDETIEEETERRTGGEIFPAAEARWKTFFIRSRNALREFGNKLKPNVSKIGGVLRESRPKERLSRFLSTFSDVTRRLKNTDWKNRKIFVQTAVVIVVLAIGFYGIAALVKKRNEQKKLSQEIATQSAEPAPVQSLDDVNVKNIEMIEEIANFSQEANRLTFLGNFLYAAVEKSSSLLKVDPGSKNIEEIKANLDAGNFELVSAMPHLNSLFILTENNKIISFTPINKNFQENNISLPENLKAVDMKTYLTYLYFLDPSANQVYRFPRASLDESRRAEGGFGEMQNWLRSGSDIKNVRSFAVNDDLFAANSSDITPYFQGKVDGNINFEKPNVPLSIDKIFSEPDMEFIWALDNKNHRVVQYDKQGKIINQYFNASITSVKDFSVDEKDKTVYLLKGNNISKFSFE